MNGSLAVVVYVGAGRIEIGEMTVGQMSSFLFYVNMLMWAFMIFNFSIGTAMAVTGVV